MNDVPCALIKPRGQQKNLINCKLKKKKKGNETNLTKFHASSSRPDGTV